MKHFIILSFLIISCSIAKAQYPLESQKPRGREHKGFFLSMSMGPNFAMIDNDINRQTTERYSGMGPIMDLKIGGAIKEDLILHGTLISNFASGPEITVNGQSQNTPDDLMIGEDFVGGGVTYYMPSNVFMSGSLGIGSFRIMNTKEETSVSSDNGLGIQLKAGKEWWVSRKWGLGIAFSYSKLKLTNTPGGGLEEHLNSNNFGIHFNATLN